MLLEQFPGHFTDKVIQNMQEAM